MTDAKLVEKVARSIFKTGYDLGPLWVFGSPTWGDLNPYRRSLMYDLARAAIKAMEKG